jgi:transcriptional regulator with XRE-family HTH domain
VHRRFFCAIVSEAGKRMYYSTDVRLLEAISLAMKAEPVSASVNKMEETSRSEPDDATSPVGQSLKQWCRLARRHAKISQSSLAVKLGVPLKHVAQWELPQRVNQLPSETQIAVIARITGYPVSTETVNFGLVDGEVHNPVKPLAAQRQARSVSEEIVAIAEVLSARTSDEPDKIHRNAAIFAQRYGIAGKTESSLQRIGFLWGLTRQGTQRIISRMLTQCVRCRAHLRNEQFILLAKELTTFGDMSVDRIQDALQERLGGTLSLVHAKQFASDVLGQRLDIPQSLRSKNRKA